jgi:hypothetical protein
MDEEHNKLVGWCLDFPEEAAIEIARLRDEVEVQNTLEHSNTGWFIAGVLGGVFLTLVFF